MWTLSETNSYIDHYKINILVISKSLDFFLFWKNMNSWIPYTLFNSRQTFRTTMLWFIFLNFCIELLDFSIFWKFDFWLFGERKLYFLLKTLKKNIKKVNLEIFISQTSNIGEKKHTILILIIHHERALLLFSRWPQVDWIWLVSVQRRGQNLYWPILWAMYLQNALFYFL